MPLQKIDQEYPAIRKKRFPGREKRGGHIDCPPPVQIKN